MQLISDLNNHKENLRGQLQHSYFSELVGLITSEICILCILLDVQLLIISGQVRFFFCRCGTYFSQNFFPFLASGE